MSSEIIVQSWLLCDCFCAWLSPARSKIINLCRNKNFTTSTLQSAIIPGQVTFWLNAMKQMQMPGEVWRTIFKAGFREGYPSNIRAMLARQKSESWKFAIFGILSLQLYVYGCKLFLGNSSFQRVGHARTYFSALPSVTIGKVKAPLAMGSGEDKDKDKHRIWGHNFQGAHLRRILTEKSCLRRVWRRFSEQSMTCDLMDVVGRVGYLKDSSEQPVGKISLPPSSFENWVVNNQYK